MNAEQSQQPVMDINTESSEKCKPKPPPKPLFDTTTDLGPRRPYRTVSGGIKSTVSENDSKGLINRKTKPPLLPKPQIPKKTFTGSRFSTPDFLPSERSAVEHDNSIGKRDHKLHSLSDNWVVNDSELEIKSKGSNDEVLNIRSPLQECTKESLFDCCERVGESEFSDESLIKGETENLIVSNLECKSRSSTEEDFSSRLSLSNYADEVINVELRIDKHENSFGALESTPVIFVSEKMREESNLVMKSKQICDNESHDNSLNDLEHNESRQLLFMEFRPVSEVDSHSTSSSSCSLNEFFPDEEKPQNISDSNSSLAEVRNNSFLYSLNSVKSLEPEKCDISFDVNLENSSRPIGSSTPKLINSSTVHSLCGIENVCFRSQEGDCNRAGSWSESFSRQRANSMESTDESTSVRRRISTWFGSFGKGSKQKNKRESCLFYCDNVNESDTKKDNSDGNLVTGENETDNGCGERLSIPCAETGEQNSKVTSSSSHDTLGCVGFDGENSSRCSVSEESFEVDGVGLSPKSDEVKDCIKSETPAEGKLRKAFYVARELMSSEKVFIDVLKLLCFDFKDYIKEFNKDTKPSVIPEDELDKIFTSLPQLLHLSEDLYQDLESRIQAWNMLPKISDVLVKKGPFLKLCSVYIQNFESQCSYLDECCQKYPRFARALKSFEQSERCKKLTLKHYMLKPVQRIPQYRMLLDDYLSHLDSTSPDFEDTRIALQIVSDVANHANKSIKNVEHLCKLLQLQAQLGNYEIIRPYRKFIKEGELCKLSRKENQLRYFILLNDCLLYTSFYGSMTGYRVKYELPLNGMKVTVPQIEDCQTEFSIITSTRSFTLRARSVEECDEWVTTLRNAIKDNNSRQLTFLNINFVPKNSNAEAIKLGKEAPIWIQDKKVTMCQSCTAEFTVTFRRHHCRACGKVVCGICSENKAPLQYLKFQSARVCDDCHEYLIKEFEDPGSNMFDAIKSTLGLHDYDLVTKTMEHIHSLFKKQPSSIKRIRKYVPQRLKEVTANDSGSQMSGCMYRKGRRAWKRLWFVLKEQVLYVYKAPEDVVALESIPVLGYEVETVKEGTYDDSDLRFIFQLSHANQHPLVFAVENQQSANRWVAAFQEATILK